MAAASINATTLRGIFNNTAVSASATISNNPSRVRSAATTSNLLRSKTSRAATAAGIHQHQQQHDHQLHLRKRDVGRITGITTTASAATVNINSNILSNNATNATSGTTNLIQTPGRNRRYQYYSNTINGWTFNVYYNGALNALPAAVGLARGPLDGSNNVQAITHSLVVAQRTLTLLTAPQLCPSNPAAHLHQP